MADSPRTTIGQFSTTGGQVQGRAPNVRAVEPAADLPESQRGKLYMLAEVTGAGGGHAALYRQMLNAAQTAFYEPGGTQASALIRAIRSVHAVVLRANQTLDANWRAGITLAVLEGWSLRIAQAGPGLCLVSHPKTVEQFPGSIDAWTQAFGDEERPDVKTFETRVEPGTMILLAESQWLWNVSPEQLAVASTANDVEIAADYLAQIAGKADLSALVVFVGEAEDAPETVVALSPEAAPKPAPADDVAKVAAATAAASAVTKEPRTGIAGRLFGGRPKQEEQPPEAVPPPLPTVEAPAETKYTPPVEYAEPIEQPRGRSPWPLVLALIVIPLLVGGLVLAMWSLRAREAEAEFVQTLDGARTAISDAIVQPDEAAARLRLAAAGEFLDKATEMRPEDPRLAEVRDLYRDEFERVNRVAPIYGIVPLWDFKGEGRDLSRVLVSGDSLYVLDKGLDEAYRFVLSQLKDSVTPVDDGKPILSKGSTIDNTTVSELTDMTWIDATGVQRSRLLALDTVRNLFSYDVTWNTAKAPLASPEKLLAPELIAGYNGNLYIADSQANQIWRYRPGQNGYENAPEAYFAAGKETSLEGLEAMAIDGSIWLLFADGRLLKYMAGEQQAFSLKNYPDQLSQPVSLAVAQQSDRLYVADAGGQRILEFDKEGEFLRQLQDREGVALKDMRSIFLDETSNALFILTADKMWKAPISEQAPQPTATPAQ
jgi:hypothetical protein